MPVKVDGFEGGDRTNIGLPRLQEEFLRKLHALGKPVVLVLLNGSALAVTWAAEQIPAIVEAWYPGQAGGDALADVLFGDYNPGGRLPVTFYRSLDDLPPFDDYRMESRTYRYFDGEPLFAFGCGLSYTQFQLDNLQITPSKIQVGNEVTVACDVGNTGAVAGDEVVQLYIHHPQATVPRPIKALKGFARVTLEPAETKTVTFTLHTDLLAIYDEDVRQVVQPGIVDVMVGSSSDNLPLIGQIDIAGPPAEVGRDKTFFSSVQIS